MKRYYCDVCDELTPNRPESARFEMRLPVVLSFNGFDLRYYTYKSRTPEMKDNEGPPEADICRKCLIRMIEEGEVRIDNALL